MGTNSLKPARSTIHGINSSNRRIPGRCTATASNAALKTDNATLVLNSSLR